MKARIQVFLLLLSLTVPAMSQTRETRTLLVRDLTGAKVTYSFDVLSYAPPMGLPFLSAPSTTPPATPVGMVQELLSSVVRNDFDTYKTLWDPVSFSEIESTAMSNFAAWQADLGTVSVAVTNVVLFSKFTVVRVTFIDKIQGQRLSDSQMVLGQCTDRLCFTNQFSKHPVVAFWNDPDGDVTVVTPLQGQQAVR